MRYRKFTYVPDVAMVGRTLHKWIETGFNEMELIDGEVDLFGNFEDEIPDEYINDLYWIEDFFQQWWNEQSNNGVTWEQIKPRGEMEVSSLPQEYSGIWIRRFGYVDMVWQLPDGTWVLWDFKTGKYSQYSVNLGLRQLYYYKSIFEGWGMPVSTIALMFPAHKQIVSRVNRKVPRGTKNVSRFSSRSMESVENLIKKSIEGLLVTPITANYNEWYCVDFCSYSDPDLLLCNFEEHQNLSKFHQVNSREELLELAVL